MPKRGTPEHRIYSSLCRMYEKFNESLMEHGKELRALKQEVRKMTKLERMKQKYPAAYTRVASRIGAVKADEIFKHIAEKKQ